MRNRGTVRADATTVRFYLSADDGVSEADMQVGSSYVSRLDPEEGSEESPFLTAPSTGGTYYYIACVEPVSEERDTENNCSDVATLTIATPDLVVEALSVDEPPEAGERFRLGAAVRNQGTGKASSTTLRYYLSTDAAIDTTDTLVDTDYVSSLEAGGSGEESGYATAPSVAGTYYYGACVDGVLAEIDALEQLLGSGGGHHRQSGPGGGIAVGERSAGGRGAVQARGPGAQPGQRADGFDHAAVLPLHRRHDRHDRHGTDDGVRAPSWRRGPAPSGRAT